MFKSVYKDWISGWNICIENVFLRCEFSNIAYLLEWKVSTDLYL